MIDLMKKAPKLSQEELDRAEAQQGGEFTKGLRSSTLGLRGSINNALGTAAEGLGFDNFAQGRYAAADELNQRAANAAPRVTDFTQINNLRDAGDFAAGIAGGLIPSLAPYVVGGAVTAPLRIASPVLRGLASSAVGYTPVETGDTIGRQREAGQEVDGLRALAGGAASAIGQGLMPMALGGQLTGRSAQALAKPLSLRQSIGGATLKDAGLEAFGEGFGEAAKQLGSTVDSVGGLNTDQILKSGVAGAVGGGIMGGVGGTAQYLHQNGDRLGQGISGAADAATGFLAGRGPTPDNPDGTPGVLGRVQGLFGAGKDAAAQQMQPVVDSPLGRATENVLKQTGAKLDEYGIPDKLDRVFKAAADKTNAGLEQVAKSEDIFGDTAQFAKDMAAAGKEGLVDLFAKNDGERMQAVKQWGDSLLKENLSPANYAKVSEAMKDLSSRANQATIASVRAARNGFNTAKQHAEDFISSVERWNNDRKFKRTDGSQFEDVVDMPPTRQTPKQIKRSEMDAGLRQRVSDELMPVLQQLRPDIFDESPESAKVLRGVGDGMRKLVLGIAEGRGVDKRTMADLLQFTGGNPEPLVQAAYRAIDTGDKKQAANVLKGIETLDNAKRAHESLQQTLTKLVSPEWQKQATPAVMRDIAAGLEQWSERAQKNPDDPNFKLRDREVRRQMETYFGKNLDSAFAAVEQNRKRVENVLAGEQGPDEQPLSSDDAMPDVDATDGMLDPNDQNAGMSEQDGEAFDQIVYMGRGKAPDGTMINGVELYPRPPATPDPKAKYADKTTQAIARAQARVDADGRGMTVSWRPASELGFDHPLIKPRFDAKVSTLMDELGITRAEAEEATKEAFRDLGAITAEGGKQETRLSKDQIKSVLYNTDYADDGSQIRTGLKGLDGKSGEVVLDATRLTNLMEGRLRNERSPVDDKGARTRKARMFMEGIAAVMDHLGGSFNIPDSTRLEKTRPNDPKFEPMTWGEAKKLMSPKGSESLAELRAQETELADAVRQANIAFAKKDAMRPLRKDGTQIYFKKGSADAKELGRLKGEQMKAKGALERVQDRAATAEMWQILNDAAQADNSAIASVKTIRAALNDPDLNPRTAAKLEEYLESRTDREAVTDEDQLKGRLETDPFGNVHRTLGGITKPQDDATIRTDSSGLPRADNPGSVGDGGRSGALFTDGKLAKTVARVVKNREVRPASKRQQNMIGEAVQQLREAFADQLQTVSFAVHAGEGTPGGTFVHTHDTITLRADILRGEDPAPGVTAVQRLRRVIAHELAHAMDRDNGYESEAAKGLQPGGKAYEEAKAVTEPRLKQMYAKVFDGSRDNAKNARELYAQLNGLYHSHPELMREHQPLAYAVIERQTNERVAAYRAAQAQSVSDGRGTARRTTQPTTPGDGRGARRPDGLSTRVGPGGINATAGSFTQGTPGTQGELDMGDTGVPGAEPAMLDIENAEALLPKGQRPPPGQGPGEGAKKRSAPSPKAVAAKKAALLKAASSGDPALLQELSTSNDAKGLQRAIDSLAGAEDANSRAAADAAQDRLGELMRSDDSVAYGMLLPKRYSLQSATKQSFPASLKADGMVGHVIGRFGPLKDAVVMARLVDGDVEMYVADKAHSHDPVLTYDLFQIDGQWEVGVDGPQPGTEPFSRLRDQFDVISYDDGSHRYSKFKPGTFSTAESRALLRTLREYAAELGISPDEVVHGRGTGNRAGMESVAMSRDQIKKFSAMQDRTRATGAQGPIDRQEVYDYLHRVLGPDIRVAWKNFLHAGEFERIQDPQGAIEDVIRLSIHSANPLNTAYHESLHAFFARLTDLKAGNVMDVLERAGSSASVMSQLKHLLRNEPDALRQLSNPEERAAYMYQFWATGQLRVGPETKTVLQRIADFIRSVLGIWSNDQRALHIMEYFHSGEFAVDLRAPVPSDTVQRRLMEPHTNKALKMARRMFSPALELGEALASAGGERLRSTGIPALRELADAMKLHGTSEGEDPGFVPAARREHMQRMNYLAKALKGTSEDALAAALQSLQTKSNAAIDALARPDDRLAAKVAKRHIRTHLDGMFDYMRDAGVKVDDLGYGKDYFPRVYDAAFISAHQQEFNAVLRRHGVADPQAITDKIMVTGGNEFTVEVDKPGMQFMKQRKLAHIPDDELAPFMLKDPLAIINSYTSQATRRAEWARRFEDSGYGITQLLAKAREQGATDAQMKTAQNFVRAVDGTLGDTIDPAARRLMGNLIVYQNIRLLPLAIFSSVVDPMGVMVRGGTVSDAWSTFKRGVKEAVKPFKKNAKDDQWTQLAQDIGVIEDSMLMHTMSGLYMQGMAGETATKINDAFFRYNLMEQWNTSVRVGAMQAAMQFLKKHADGTASKHSKRWLAELGLQPNEVVLDAQGNVDARDPKMAAAINRWVDGAVLRPDATDSAIWMSDPHFALIAHMKKFVFAFHETILKRVAHEYNNGNFAPVMALGGYVPIMIAADMLKGLIQGLGDEPEWKRQWTASDYVWHGVERAGLLGTGQFAVDALQGGVGQLSGPTLEQLGQGIEVGLGRREFGNFVLKSMPANALYAEAFKGEPAESAYVE